jgi:ankyrin repeat protein
MLIQVACLLCSSYIFFFAGTVPTGQQAPSSQSDDMKPFIEAGFPAWIALNLMREDPPERKIFVWVENQHFTEDNLHKLFTQLSSKYNRPAWLKIIAFSDEKMLERAINISQLNYSIDFTDTPEGHEAARRLFKEHYPDELGYFRAYYYRTWYEESYRYSPDAGKSDFIEVKLNSSYPPASARDSIAEMKEAIKQGDILMLEKLLSNGMDIDARDKFGWSPLIHAAKHSKTEVVRFLVNRGANVNLQSELGITALHLAAGQGDLAIVKTLLNAGAMAEVSSKAEENARNILNTSDLRNRRSEVAVGGQDTPLLRASEAGHTEIVALLLRHGANPAVVDITGKTPLIVACRHKNVLKALLDGGAAINAQDIKGWTALMHAVWQNRPEEVQFLLNRGASIELKDRRGRTALDIALEAGNKAIIDMFHRIHK